MRCSVHGSTMGVLWRLPPSHLSPSFVKHVHRCPNPHFGQVQGFQLDAAVLAHLVQVGFTAWIAFLVP